MDFCGNFVDDALMRSYSMDRARIIIEQATNTLVVHLDDRTTDFLKAIYQGKGYTVISSAVTKQELAKAIKNAGRVFMLGHGCPAGLFGRSFMIDDQFGPLLAEKGDGLYIWCNADAYAVRNKLTGLVSGMFISEVAEAAYFGIKAAQEEVDRSNANFSRIVREIMDSGRPYSDVKQCYSNAECKITTYNNERLYVFDHGTPSPALHASSASHREQEWTAAEREASQEEEGLADSEYEWLMDYISKAVDDVQDDKTDIETAAGGVVGVLGEFLPGRMDEHGVEWVANILRFAKRQRSDSSMVAQAMISELTA
jgi:hypothetical protein